MASFIGLIINAFYAVFEAPLHYRTLERNKILGLNSSTDFNQKMSLSDESKMELLWWMENVRFKNGKSYNSVILFTSLQQQHAQTYSWLAGTRMHVMVYYAMSAWLELFIVRRWAMWPDLAKFSPLWQHFISTWEFLKALFTIWQNFEPT